MIAMRTRLHESTARGLTLALCAWLLPSLLLGSATAATDIEKPPVAQSLPSVPGYVALRIANPKGGETIHDNSGRVSIDVVLRPPLRADAGHRLRVLLDGALQPGQWSGARFALQGVDRGTHTLQVIVADADGKRIIESEAVEFQMWQASRLFPSRTKTP